MNPFAAEGIWLRCALHAHTTNSDGELPPEMLVRHYEWAGYDVLAITDHWVRTVEPSTRKLLVIPSTELNACAPGVDDDAHVLALGVEADPVAPAGDFEPLADVVAWIVANGGVPYIAHTYWSGLRADQWEDCEGLSGSRSGTPAASSRSAAATRRSTGTRRSSADGSSTGSSPTTRTIPATTAASRGRWCARRSARRRPCSTRFAPAPSTARPGRRSRASSSRTTRSSCRTSPARSVTLVSSRRRGARANAGRLGYPNASEVLERDANGLITACRLERPWDGPYGRLEVADADGGRAWTNPLWLA